MITSRRNLSERLQYEWQILGSRPALARRAAGWHLGVPVTCLDDIVAATQWQTPGPGDVDGVAHERMVRANRVFTALVLAAADDELAARVVLQRLLPSLGARANRWRDRFNGRWDPAFDELVATAWVVIRRYPVHRRPSHLLAGLLRDTEHQAFVKPTRRMWETVHVAPHVLDTPVEDDEREETEPLLVLADVLATTRTVVTDDELHLMGLLASGRTAAQVAEALEVSVRTVANRRDAALHRVRAALAA